MTHSRTVALLAGLCLLADAAPAAAQFASVPKPPAPTPYAVRFGRDSVAEMPPSVRDSLRAAARADLRAWVDSAAASLGIELDLPDSVPFPLDSAALDSIARATGPDRPRADSARRDSTRRDSLGRDSVRRAPTQPPTAAAALPASAPRRMPARPGPHAHAALVTLPAAPWGLPRRPR